MRSGPTSAWILIPALASLAVAGCFVASGEQVAGKSCQTRADCADPDYDCVASTSGGGRTCQVQFPPVTPPDGGSTDAGSTDAGDGDAGSIEPAYWCGQVENLMTTYCAECHGADRSGSNQPTFRLDVYDDVDGGFAAGGLDGAKSKSARIKVRMVDFQDMPSFGHPQPTDAERDVVGRWVESGAPFCNDGGTP